MPHRLLVSLVVASLALCAATASPAPAAGAPAVTRGHALHIAFATRSLAVCTPTVRYSDGTTQTGAARKPHARHISWALLVASTAPVGAGTWSVQCGSAVAHTGRFVVVAQKGSGDGASELPRVVADKQGFSQRSDRFGGSHVSFGLMLRNTSDTQDALNVYILVNLVAANGELIATMNHTVDFVGAAQTYAYGDSMGLRSSDPIAKLELTIRVGEHQRKLSRMVPEFANVRVLQDQNDAGWVGEVDGEVLNTAHAQTLTGTHLSVVLLDAAGNVVGGGNGGTSGALPSGSRMVFVANSGFSAVPFERAVTPVVSVDASYAVG